MKKNLTILGNYTDNPNLLKQLNEVFDLKIIYNQCTYRDTLTEEIGILQYNYLPLVKAFMSDEFFDLYNYSISFTSESNMRTTIKDYITDIKRHAEKTPLTKNDIDELVDMINEYFIVNVNRFGMVKYKDLGLDNYIRIDTYTLMELMIHSILHNNDSVYGVTNELRKWFDPNELLVPATLKNTLDIDIRNKLMFKEDMALDALDFMGLSRVVYTNPPSITSETEHILKDKTDILLINFGDYKQESVLCTLTLPIFGELLKDSSKQIITDISYLSHSISTTYKVVDYANRSDVTKQYKIIKKYLTDTICTPDVFASRFNKFNVISTESIIVNDKIVNTVQDICLYLVARFILSNKDTVFTYEGLGDCSYDKVVDLLSCGVRIVKPDNVDIPYPHYLESKSTIKKAKIGDKVITTEVPANFKDGVDIKVVTKDAYELCVASKLHSSIKHRPVVIIVDTDIKNNMCSANLKIQNNNNVNNICNAVKQFASAIYVNTYNTTIDIDFLIEFGCKNVIPIKPLTEGVLNDMPNKDVIVLHGNTYYSPEAFEFLKKEVESRVDKPYDSQLLRFTQLITKTDDQQARFYTYDMAEQRDRVAQPADEYLIYSGITYTTINTIKHFAGERRDVLQSLRDCKDFIWYYEPDYKEVDKDLTTRLYNIVAYQDLLNKLEK